MDDKVMAGLRELDWLTRGDGDRPRESPAPLTGPGIIGDPATGDLLQITDPGELLAAVFDAQQEAEQHLDSACQAAGWNAAYESGGAFSESEARHYRAAAASLRRGAALLDKLAGGGNGQPAPAPGGACYPEGTNATRVGEKP